MPHVIHNAMHAKWEIVISKLETSMLIGIHSHENTPQRIWVDANIHGHYPAYPANIEQCINYDLINNLITHEWPKRTQTSLLESLVMECFEYIFANITSASHATIGIYKPDIFKQAEKVGVRLTLTRAEFLTLKADKP